MAAINKLVKASLSARDAAIKAEKDRTDNLLTKYSKLSKISDQVENLKSQLIDVEKEIKDWADAYTNLEQYAQDNALTADPSIVATLADYYKKKKAAQANQLTLTAQRDRLSTQQAIDLATQDTATQAAIQAAAAAVTTTGTGAYGNISKPGNLPLTYNASAVKEAYFSSRGDYQATIDKNHKGSLKGLMQSYNQPSTVLGATDLWSSSIGSKGMIVTAKSVLQAWNSGSNKPNTADAGDNHNYGFQFHYNPGTVGMSYFTSPNVDVTMMTSGQEMYNLAGLSGSQGSVSFQVVINRIGDFQFFTSDGSLKQGFTPEQIYPKPPTRDELDDVYKKGTMYDVEYLLRVLMGTTMSSYLRGQRTADMGWLPAMPVELHLGKSLRYLGVINNLSINHIIFNENMTPMFSTMDITFARLPDYPA